MNYIYQGLIGLLLTVGIISCSDDQPKDPTIFPTTSEKLNDFEQWLDVNYRSPYNIRFKYKLEDSETDLSYHFIPADSAKTAKLAIITKYLWFDAYAEVLGPEFMKLNAPRILVAIGTPGYTRQRTEVVGSADGGYKVILGKVNSLTDQALADYETMTTYYFHTMHHEFTHILNQKKPYPVAYDQISKADYLGSEWIRKKDPEALRAGFISPYSMENPGEDIAELQSYYITTTPQKWEEKLNKAGKSGRAIIEQKLDILRGYLKNSWNIDIDQLRDAVLRRTHQVSSLDLNQLN